jgi:hypothetical protein
MTLVGGPIIKVSHFQSDGGAYNLELGFVPDYIMLWNLAAVAGEIAIQEWFADLGDAYAIVHRMLADNGSTGYDTVEYITSGGAISKLDSTTIDAGTANDDTDPVRKTAARGVTIATGWLDDDDEVYFLAIGNAKFEDIGDVA